MKLSRLSLTLLSVLVLSTAACSETAGTMEPEPTPTPPPVDTPAPPSGAREIEFTPDTLSPVNEAVAISIASAPPGEGKIGLAVTAYNLANHTTIGAPGVAGIYGRVKWDAALFVFDGAGRGAFLQQGGVQSSCCFPGEAHIEPSEGTFPFSLQRPTGSPQVTGSGEIILFRLRPRDALVEGTTRVELTVITPIWPELIRLRPLPRYSVPQNIYGGTLTIR